MASYFPYCKKYGHDWRPGWFSWEPGYCRVCLCRWVTV